MEHEAIDRQPFTTGEEASYLYEHMPPIEYYGLVECINSNTIAALSQQLEGLELPGDAHIAVAGSDGKCERHTQSKTELIILQRNGDHPYDQVVREYIGNNNYDQLFDTDINGSIDIKILNDPRLISAAFGKVDTIYPDRALNIFPVYPLTDESMELYFQTRERVLEEIGNNKSVRARMKTQLRDYRRTIRTGKYRNVQTFDAENGVQYYSELWPEYTTGFKLSFIRAVQRKLDLFTAQLYTVSDLSVVARDMPTTTVGRLDYLAGRNIIDLTTATETGEAYAWFLQQYHHIQEKYKETGTPTALTYNIEAFKAYSKQIIKFIEI